MSINTKVFFGLLFIAGSNLLAQQKEIKTKLKQPLPVNIKFADVNCDTLISDQEAQIVFAKYLKNPARKSNSDLAEEVQSIMIDLVGYIEKVNCDQLKRLSGSAEFIEIFYSEKFDPIRKGL